MRAPHLTKPHSSAQSPTRSSAVASAATPTLLWTLPPAPRISPLATPPPLPSRRSARHPIPPQPPPPQPPPPPPFFHRPHPFISIVRLLPLTLHPPPRLHASGSIHPSLLSRRLRPRRSPSPSVSSSRSPSLAGHLECAPQPCPNPPPSLSVQWSVIRRPSPIVRHPTALSPLRL